jgi:predicted PurR-regulated permease PerM
MSAPSEVDPHTPAATGPPPEFPPHSGSGPHPAAGAGHSPEPELVFYRRGFALVTIALLAVLLYRITEPFLAPLAWASVLAFLLHPLQLRLARLWRGRATLVAMLLTALTTLLFVGPLTLLGGAFASEAGALITTLQRDVARLQLDDLQALADLPVMRRMLAFGEQHLSISAEQLRAWLVAGAQRLLEPIASLGGQAFLGALGTAVSFTLMLFLLFFLLRDGVRILHAILGLVPLAAARKQRLAAHLGDVTRAVVFGTLVTSLLQGATVAVGFRLVDLPSPIVFGVLAALLSVLPFGGTAFVWLPAGVWLLLTGRSAAGLFLLAWGALVVVVADNLLRPVLISGRTHVPTLAVFVGVLGGLAAFGLVGLFLGPIVIALTLVFVRAADAWLASR